MNDSEILAFCDKAFSQFKEECLKEHALPIMLMVMEADTENAQVFQLCTHRISCEEMIRCLHNAIKNCNKEILERKFKKCGLN